MPINVSRCRNTRWFDIYALMISCKLTNQGIYPPYICVKFDYLTSFSHILLCTCVLDLHLGTCIWLLIDRWHKQISNWLQYRSHYRLWIRLIHLPLYCTRWFQVRRGVMARRCYLGKNISDIGCKQASEEAKRDGTLYIHWGCENVPRYKSSTFLNHRICHISSLLHLQHIHHEHTAGVCINCFYDFTGSLSAICYAPWSCAIYHLLLTRLCCTHVITTALYGTILWHWHQRSLQQLHHRSVFFNRCLRHNTVSQSWITSSIPEWASSR